MLEASRGGGPGSIFPSVPQTPLPQFRAQIAATFLCSTFPCIAFCYSPVSLNGQDTEPQQGGQQGSHGSSYWVRQHCWEGYCSQVTAPKQRCNTRAHLPCPVTPTGPRLSPSQSDQGITDVMGLHQASTQWADVCEGFGNTEKCSIQQWPRQLQSCSCKISPVSPAQCTAGLMLSCQKWLSGCSWHYLRYKMDTTPGSLPFIKTTQKQLHYCCSQA